MTVSPEHWPIAPHTPTPLVTQIVDYCADNIRRQLWKGGARLPSIRQLAELYEVSRFTVAEAYERLVARGLISSRRGAGYYVASKHNGATSRAAHPADSALARDVEMMRKVLPAGSNARWKPSGGSLPDTWLTDGPLASELRALAQAPQRLVGYGEPQGYLPLRQALVHRLDQLNIDVSPEMLTTTASATHALDLILRVSTEPGDTVLVDDPSYYNFHAALRLARVHVVGVPRTPSGPDTDALAAALARHRPKLFLTVSALHNPTGSSLTLPVAHKVLTLLAQWNCLAVEDDINADFQRMPGPRLAALDGLNRVIYLTSFTKTLSANLRCGFIAAAPERIAALTDVKLITGITTSETVEQLIYRLLTGGRYRRHLDKLLKQLDARRGVVVAALRERGFKPWQESNEGFMVWAELPSGVDPDTFSAEAAADGILLACGRHFSLDGSAKRYLRLNIARCDDAELWQRLDKHLTTSRI
jgi:DNA-binding transcriptional MocR family regulator